MNIELLIELTMLTKEDLQWELDNNKNNYDKEIIEYIKTLLNNSTETVEE